MSAHIIIAGFTIGILGSFHCIGMCGPIALALPVADATKWKRIFFILLYNVGRVSAYAIIGAIFGIVGNQFFIGGYQQFLSIFLGVVILLLLFFSKYIAIKSKLFLKYSQSIKQILGKLLRSDKQFYSYLLIGFANGFLPCGLVYVAVAGAVATGSIMESALFMASFGLGTFPIMVAVTALGKYISLQWRNQIRKAVPILVAFMAILLILRGLNLGIPYISPIMKATETGTESCCHKE